MHAGDLPIGEHDHGRIVDVIHVVHEHVTIGTVVAGNVWEGRLAVVRKLRVGRIVNEIGTCAILGVAPDVTEVEPVPNFVRRRAAEIERRCSVAHGSERRVEDHDAVSCRRPAGELRIAEQTAA